MHTSRAIPVAQGALLRAALFVIFVTLAALLVVVPAYAQDGADADGDGLPDGWEIQYNLNPNSSNGIHGAAGDPDRDGLPNGDEFANFTDPRNPDTDGDSLPDLWEVENVVNPLNGAGGHGPNGDADGDGLLNRDEMAQGADPHNRDSDSDILPDGWEVVEGISPKDNRGRNGPQGDADGDGETNIAKFRRINKYY